MRYLLFLSIFTVSLQSGALTCEQALTESPLETIWSGVASLNAQVRNLEDHSKEEFSQEKDLLLVNGNEDLSRTEGHRLFYVNIGEERWLSTVDVEVDTQRVSVLLYRFDAQNAQDKLRDFISREAKRDLGHILNSGFYFQDRRYGLASLLRKIDFKVETTELSSGAILYKYSFNRFEIENDELTGDFTYTILNRLFGAADSKVETASTDVIKDARDNALRELRAGIEDPYAGVGKDQLLQKPSEKSGETLEQLMGKE